MEEKELKELIQWESLIARITVPDVPKKLLEELTFQYDQECLDLKDNAWKRLLYYKLGAELRTNYLQQGLNAFDVQIEKGELTTLDTVTIQLYQI